MAFLESKNEDAVCAMRSVYWLAEEQVPTSKYKSLLNLQKLQGCSFPDELQLKNIYASTCKNMSQIL
jgi:hypothetical protein